MLDAEVGSDRCHAGVEPASLSRRRCFSFSERGCILTPIGLTMLGPFCAPEASAFATDATSGFEARQQRARQTGCVKTMHHPRPQHWDGVELPRKVRLVDPRLVEHAEL